MSTVTLRQVEESIQQSKDDLELAESLARLKNNRDFRKVITDGLFKEEAVHLVQLKAQPDSQSPEAQKSVLTRIDAIGALYQYFLSIESRAEMAEKSIEVDEQTRDEILAESLK